MINHYDKESKELVVNLKIPQFCVDYFNNDLKKCKSFYVKAQEEKMNGDIFTCPYGFSCYKSNHVIYTTLLIQNNFDKNKVVTHLKDNNEKLSDYTVYTEEFIYKIFNSMSSLLFEKEIHESALHDLKNASSHFIDMAEALKNATEYKQFLSDNEVVYSAIEGYSLINYMLMYHDSRLAFTSSSRLTDCVIHRMIYKLEKLLRFKAKKKNVVIEISGINSMSFRMFDDVYLAYYILLENAIKYSLPFSKIEIHINDVESNKCEVKFINQTRNIQESDLPHLTKNGYRSELSLDKPGSGIGLYLAQRIFANSKISINFNLIVKHEMTFFEVTTLVA